MSRGLILLCLSAAVFWAGCQSPVGPAAEAMPRCRGKESIEAAAAALAMQRANLVPIRASARCVIEWTEPDGSRMEEKVDAQLRFVPPDRLFVRGDKFGEIRFGTNAEAFWFMVKPEIDTYWWGRRDLAERCVEKLRFNPWHVTEALGVVEVDESWELDWHDGYDILTQRDAAGGLVRKIWVRACDYQVACIETADAAGGQVVRIEMDQYTAAEPGLSVPAVIEARHLTDGRTDAVLRVELRGIRRFEADSKSLERLFSRPSEDRYGTVYRLVSTCDFVEVGR